MTVVSRLSPLQERVLDELAGMEPAWTLFGAGALIGFHLGHRTLQVEHVQTAVSFARLRVMDATESIELDLVADPTSPVEPPAEPRPGVRVDTARDLLAQKLCALLSRTELRDLEDVGALLDAGGDLQQGLVDAVLRDAGFSPPTLAWLLQSFPIERADEENRNRDRLLHIRERLLTALRA